MDSFWQKVEGRLSAFPDFRRQEKAGANWKPAEGRLLASG